jgi:hypothetical protein
MPVLAETLQRLHRLTALAAFGGTLAAALHSGADPLWAAARAGGCALAMLFFFPALCRLTLLLLGVEVETPETAAPAGIE